MGHAAAVLRAGVRDETWPSGGDGLARPQNAPGARSGLSSNG